MTKIQEYLKHMGPESALGEIATALKRVLPQVSAEERQKFVMQIIGGAGDDKVSSLVHL